ncbi:DUF6340 family protein [Thermophagus sp. OGC60D27]|uniref:DUF6340 family protein n=1 Tax=Thermophagus sp. OGC60D27 TaxID=3458415 RepID=UPI0040383963
MYRIKNWSCFALILILSGCVSYTTIGLDVQKPAGVEIPVDIASVVVVDHAPPFTKIDSGIHKIILPGKKYVVDTILLKDFGKLAIESMAEVLKSKQFFDSVHVYPQKLDPVSTYSLSPSLSTETLDSICDRYNAQGLIALDYFDYGTTLQVSEAPDIYYSTLDARSRTRWKIYNRLTGKTLDVHVQKDTIFWDGIGYSITGSAAELPPIREALKMAAQHAGAKYSDYVAPSWESQSRLIYIKGHPLFYKASELVANNQWEEAGRIWYYVYLNGSPKQKARAAFNLALSKEMTGDFREAAAWAWNSMEEYAPMGNLSVTQAEKDACKSYYILLAQRIQEKKKIDNQYGIEE